MGHETRRARRLVRIGVAAALVGAVLPAAAFVDVAHAAIKIWDGGGGNANWTTGGNWVGDSPPVAGDALVFPAGPVNKATNNDFAQGTTFESLTVEDSGYSFGGNGIQTTTVTTTHASGQVNFGLGNGGPGLIVPPGGTLTETVGAGGEVFQSMQIDLGNGTLVYAVNGTLNIPHNFVNVSGGSVVRNGAGVVQFTSGGGAPLVPWTIQSGTTYFNANNLFGSVVTQTGGTVGGSQAFLTDYTGSGGILSPGNATFEVATLNVQGGDLDIGAGTTYDVDINDVNTYDRMFINGGISLGGTLSIDAGGFIPTGGQTLLLLNNDTSSDPVSGTFAGLPEGATVNVNGGNMTISYVGGDGNDVTLSSPPAFVWDGGGGADDNWMTASNWVNDVAPSGLPTETLEFPNSGDTTVINNFPAGTTFGNIVFSFADYVITGQPFKIADAVVSTAGANFNTIAADIEFTQNGDIAIPNAGVQIRFTGDVLINSGAVTLSGGGFAQFSGSLTGVGGLLSAGPNGGAFLGGDLTGFGGGLTIDGGYVQVDGDLGAADVTVNGVGTLAGSGTVGPIVANGGTIQPSDITPPGAILAVNGNLTMQAPSTLSLDVDAITPGVGHDQLAVTGTVTLAGTLQLTATVGPPLNQVLTIIDNDGADPVTGTFAGLPEGSTVTVNGIPMLVSYVGGDGNDVTLSTTAKVWDGGGANDNWTTGANWVGDVAPVPSATQTIVFPDVAARKTNVNDFPGPTPFKDVLFTGSGYNLTGAGLDLFGAVIATNTSGTNTVTMQVDLNAPAAFTQASGGELITVSTLLISASKLTLAGDGNFTLNGQISGTNVDKTGNGLAVFDADSPTFTGTLTVSAGTAALAGNIAAAVVVNGGSLVGSGAVGGGITANGGAVAPGFLTKGVLTTSIYTASAPAVTGFEVDGNNPGVDQDQLVVNGPVVLAGFLGLNTMALPPIAQEIVLISKTTPGPVSGTFNGVPEGGSVLIGGGPWSATISYVGGDGNDVTMFVAPTFTWDGGGADSSWSTPENWVNDVAPTGTGGETLVFPNGATQTANQNDTANATFAEIRFTGSGYVLAGVGVNLTGGVTATNVSGSNTYVVPTDAPADLTVAQAAGGTLSLGLIDLNGGVLHVVGAGAHNVGDQITDGDIDVSAVGSGSVTVSGSLPTLGGSVFVNSGLLVLDGDLVGDVQVAGGRLEGDGGAAGLVATAGAVAPGGAATAVLDSTTTLDLDVAATFEVDLSTPTPGIGHDQIATTGNVSLGSALSVAVTGAVMPGDQFTIVDNGSANAVSGTFAGLADGAAFIADGVAFTIDYQGGDGNDVVLVAGPHASLSTAAVATAEGGPGGSTSAGLSVMLDQVAPGDVVVHVAITGGTAVPGTDVSALDMDLTIPGGSTSVAVPLNLLGDDVVEPDETVEVTLTAVSGTALAAPTTATVTITNDDTATITVTNPNVVITEGGPGSQGLALAAVSQLTLALDHPSSTDIGVHIATADGTATAPADYAAFDQVFTIPAGATSFVVPLSIVDDNLDEPDETFTIRFLGATGALLAASDITVTLVDNDVPTVTPPSTPPGGGTPTTVDPGTLPATGGSPNRTLWLALALLGLGAVLVAVRRRRTA